MVHDTIKYNCNKKEKTMERHNSMNKIFMHYAEWKKPGSKYFIPYDLIHMAFLKRQNYRDRNDISSFQE